MTGGYLLKIQGTKGWPDRLCILSNGQHFFCEFKAPGEVPTSLQQYYLDQLQLRGHPAFAIDNYEAFIKAHNEHSRLPTAAVGPA